MRSASPSTQYIVLQSLKELANVDGEVVDETRPLLGREKEEPDAIPTRVEACGLEIKGDGFRRFKLGY